LLVQRLPAFSKQASAIQTEKVFPLKRLEVKASRSLKKSNIVVELNEEGAVPG